MTEPAGADEFRTRWFVEPIEAMLNRPGTKAPDAVVQLDTGDEPLVIEASGGQVRARTGTVPKADVVLHGPPDASLGVLMGFLDPAGKRGRAVTVDGDPGALTRLRTGRSQG
jgi:hypothetical protein